MLILVFSVEIPAVWDSGRMVRRRLVLGTGTKTSG